MASAVTSFLTSVVNALKSALVNNPQPGPVKNAVAATKSVPKSPPSNSKGCPFAKGDCGSNMNIDDAVSHLDKNFLPPYGKGRCAEYVRKAIEAGGVKLDPNTRPFSAKDYGPYLSAHGFKEVSQKGYVPQKGDIVVLQGFPEGPPNSNGVPSYKASEHGHITMFNGKKWGSDFEQTDMWSGPGYRKAKPDYVIFRP